MNVFVAFCPNRLSVHYFEYTSPPPTPPRGPPGPTPTHPGPSPRRPTSNHQSRQPTGRAKKEKREQPQQQQQQHWWPGCPISCLALTTHTHTHTHRHTGRVSPLIFFLVSAFLVFPFLLSARAPPGGRRHGNNWNSSNHHQKKG